MFSLLYGEGIAVEGVLYTEYGELGCLSTSMLS
jgi:hypothetical protein